MHYEMEDCYDLILYTYIARWCNLHFKCQQNTRNHIFEDSLELLLQSKCREMFQSSPESLTKVISSQAGAHKISAEIQNTLQILPL